MQDWVNGQPSVALSLKDRGLAYGDGLFETIAVIRGQPLLLRQHLLRLEEGCRRLCLPVDLSLAESELMRFSKRLGDGVVKLIVTRGDGERGYRLPRLARPLRILQCSAVPFYPEGNQQRGIALYPCTTCLSEQPLLAGIKHLNRLEQVLARAEWDDDDFAEGLMRDTSGRVVEGIFSNLFMVSQGQLITADLSRCGVAGVMRAELLARAAPPCVIRDIAYEEFLEAEEVFLCNSLYGVWPVVALADYRWSVGPVTRRMQDVARRLLEG